MYSLYHQCNKKQSKLLDPVAKDLEVEIVKIGQVKGPRWAACSLQAASAVWCAYPVLYIHFYHSYSSLANIS